MNHDLFAGYESPLERAKRKYRPMQSVDELVGITERVPMYPQSAGFKGAETSRQAAESINVTGLRAQVLKALRNLGDATADEAAEYLRIDKLSIRPRFSELSEVGKVIATDKRRKNASGRSAVVWRLA